MSRMDEINQEFKDIAAEAAICIDETVKIIGQYSKEWWRGIVRDATLISQLIIAGGVDIDDAEAYLKSMKSDLARGLAWHKDDLKKRYGLSDDCGCSARDLWTFGHRCGRKAPIDRR